MVGDRGYELVGAGDQYWLLSNALRQLYHEPLPLRGVGIGVGAKIALPINCVEAWLVSVAVNAESLDVAPRQIPHEHNASLVSSRHYHWWAFGVRRLTHANAPGFCLLTLWPRCESLGTASVEAPMNITRWP